MNKNWYKNAYRRNVVDMHITDFKKEFLSKFNTEEYISMLKRTSAKSAVVYAHSHVGFCLYPTKTGKMHPNLEGRDIFGEVCRRCNDENIAIVGYMSVIFDTYAYDTYPEWSIINPDGKPQSGDGRYGVLCPNNPEYRKYSAGIAQEIVSYNVNGIRFDMTFWPGVCYCDECRKRFAEEAGGEIPQVVDWHDPKWVAFQRCREKWITEYAEFMTNAVREVNNDVSVEHQSSVYAHTWGNAVTYELSNHSDFLQGDFYGGYVQGSTACKLFYNLSPSLPFGFETSSNENLFDHTTLKKECMLKTKSYMAIANSGAFVFIDAIDPTGTLNPHVYDVMGRVFDETSRYEGLISGELCQDAVIYLSSQSRCSFKENGMNVREPQKESPHLEGFFKVSRAFIKNHIPYGVITYKNINDISKYKVIILSNVLMMSENEVCAFREYVRNGGKIYASEMTSLTDINGYKKDNFMLSDVFGVNYKGETEENVTYFSPSNEGSDIFPNYYCAKRPIFYNDRQILSEVSGKGEIIAEMVLPYTNPGKARPFASIHSNPPGEKNGYPSIVKNKFGKGVCIWSAAQFELNECYDEFFASMINNLIKIDDMPKIITNAPRQVEILTHKNNSGYSVSGLSFQAEMPNLPIGEFELSVNTGTSRVKEVLLMPDKTSLNFISGPDGYTKFTVPCFDTFTNIQIAAEQ